MALSLGLLGNIQRSLSRLIRKDALPLATRAVKGESMQTFLRIRHPITSSIFRHRLE